MARARSSGGGGAATAWLIVFLGIGFVVSLVLAIVFYTQVTGADERAQQATRDLQVYADREVQNAPAVSDLVAQVNQQGSVVRQLLTQNEQLKGFIGDAQRSAEELIQHVRTDLNVPDNASLLAHLRSLAGNLQSVSQQRDQLQANLERAQQEALQAGQRADQRAQAYDRQVAELRQQLASVTEQFEAYQASVSQMENQLREQISEAQRSRQERVTALEAEVDRLGSEVQEWQRRHREATRRGEPIDPPDVVRADGQVVTVQESSSIAYINLGRADNIVLGLTFEVFDGGELIRVGELTEVTGRGKATVEVVNVGDTSARVRIVRQARGATLAQGDQIVNLIYDPRTRYRFFVYGEFDLDRTGTATAADRQRVETTITRWNGQLAEDLDYNVDYLVLGEVPAMPGPLPPGEIDPVRIREHVEATRVYERYQELIAQAREQGIPVLNQNRFLSLIGYYQR